MAKTFNDLKLNNWIIRQCNAMGIRSPTPIQVNCIPHILSGGDCIGCAKTGSGKTLAFALPILQKLCEDPYGIFAIILTPTRELVYQISDTFSAIGKAMNLRQCVIVGGMDMVSQGQALARRPHLVIATPGRLADHLESCDTFSLKRIKFLVLDEADRLLSGAFDEQLRTVFSVLPRDKQTLLFSATMTEALDTVKQVATNQVLLWEAESETATVDQLEQLYVLCPVAVRDGYLVQTILTYSEKHPNPSIMIFTDTCKSCQLLSIMLNEVGFDNVALHGMIPQKERLASLARFKSNIARILVATDVASRGLDIPTVELVINHTMPSSATIYIHRVGRTARAGRGGTAISLVTPHDIALLQAVEQHINTKLTEFPINGKEVAKIFTQVSVTKREAEIKLDQGDFEERKKINKRKKLILEGKDPDEEERKIEEEKKRLRKQLKLLQKRKLQKKQKEIRQFMKDNVDEKS